jgi:hypothetical protein
MSEGNSVMARCRFLENALVSLNAVLKEFIFCRDLRGCVCVCVCVCAAINSCDPIKGHIGESYVIVYRPDKFTWNFSRKTWRETIGKA